MAVGDYGRAGWVFEVEAMVKKAKPVFDKSRSVILDARYEIPGFRGMKGTVVDRTAKILGVPTPKGKILVVPTGKIQGLKHDVEGKFDRLIHAVSEQLTGESPRPVGGPEEDGPIQM
jgi:hypothetical protein